MTTDLLSFLDTPEAEESDTLSFLDQPENKDNDLLSFLDEGNNDSLSFLDSAHKSWTDVLTPKPFKSSKSKEGDSFRQNTINMYQPDELPENATIQQKMQFNQEMQNARDVGSLPGLVKGIAAGATADITEEYVPGLKPEENEYMVGLGKTIGAVLPIGGLFKIMGAPLIKLAAKSPIAAQGLMSLARMTGMGLSGATYGGVTSAVHGEVPTPKELLKEGATWFAIDAGMQALGLGIAFNQAVRNIAASEGVPARQVLGRLWDSTKGFVKSKFNRSIKTPKDITPGDIEILSQEAEKAVQEVKPVEAEIEIKPIEEVKPTKAEETPKEIEEIKSPEPVEEVKPSEITKEVEKAKHPATSPKELGEQKKYFIDKLKNALDNPPKGEYLDIEIPGDGEFKIKNNPESINLALKKVSKWPINKLVTKPPTYGVKKPSSKSEPTLSAKKPHKPIPSTKAKQPNPIGQKQAVARSKLINLLRKAFKDPIRIGKFRSKVKGGTKLGFHRLWSKVSRLLHANDVETAVHEIGHNLHTELYGGDAKNGQEQFKNIKKALQPYESELAPLGHYEPFTLEGFAEFTRMYVTNPDTAKKLAPNFYAKFEADLDAQYPDLKNALLEARDYYDAYLEGTPQSRIRAQTSYVEDTDKLENIKDAIVKGIDNLKTQYLDDVYPAKKMVAELFGIPINEVENLKDPRNLYRSLRLLKGAVGKADVFTMYETFDYATLDKINGSLRDILKKLPDKESYREFNDYLIARRSKELQGRGIETGINFADAFNVESQLRPKYGDLAKELDKYNDSLLRYVRDSGLLSDEQYKNIKKNNLMYVPFQREMGKKGGVASGAGKTQANKPIKRIKGSTRDIISPIESVLKNTYAMIINAEKNQTGLVFSEFSKMKNSGTYIERVPTPITLKAKVHREEIERSVIKHLMDTGQGELLEMSDGKMVLRSDLEDIIPDLIMKFGPTTYPAGENIITVYREGKPEYYEVSPELFEMWTQGTAPYTANIVTKILRIPARTLRAGAILNPKFIQKNFIRDTWGSLLFTKYGKGTDVVGQFIDTLYSPLAMMATSAKKGPLYVEWLKSGGGMSTMQSLDRDTVVKKLQEVRDGYKAYQVIKWLRAVAEISEEANRLNEFGKALEVEGKTRLGKEIAAFAARDLSIDFAKMGLQMKALNQIISFFNATIQGGAKFLRTLGSKDRSNFIGRLTAFVVIPSLILAWLNKDDENVKEFYEEEKDFNFITNLNGTYLKIPVPFEAGVLAHGLTQRMFNYFVKKDPEAFEKFMGSVLSAMLPNMIPTLANPLIESFANKSFFTGGRIIPADKENLVSRYQYKNNTSSTARLVGRAMTYMLGQDTRSKAASPAIIDHFITSWTGGLGRLVVNILDSSLEKSGIVDPSLGPERSVVEQFGLDAFRVRYPRSSTRSIEKFYDNYQDATARQKTFKYLEKQDLDQEAEEAKQRFDKIYDYPTLQRAYKSMQESQKAINQIWLDPSIEKELKQQMIDDLYLQRIEFAKAANEEIRLHRLASD